MLIVYVAAIASRPQGGETTTQVAPAAGAGENKDGATGTPDTESRFGPLFIIFVVYGLSIATNLNNSL